MKNVGLGYSTNIDPAAAAAEAARASLEHLGDSPPDAAIVVSTTAYGGMPASAVIAATAVEALGTPATLGASLDGLMVGGRECVGEPAVAILSFAGLDVEFALVEGVAGREARVGEELAAQLGVGSDAGDLVVLFSDALSLDGQALATGLAALAPATLAGVAAADAGGESQPVWIGPTACLDAVVAMRMGRKTGDSRALDVTQACRAVGPPHEIIRNKGHWILDLDGRPALDVYRESLPVSLREDLPRASRSMLVALGAEDAFAGKGGLARVRNVTGFDPDRGGFSIAEVPRPGDQVVLSVLDPTAARQDLERLGRDLNGRAPEAVLYLNCRARAEALFGHEGLELGHVERLFGATPALGLLGSHLYARTSPSDRCELLTYAAVAVPF